MLASRWYKVLSDLLGNKTRTVLIVLSITVGLFAVGTIVSSQTILREQMAQGYASIHPSSGTVRTLELFDQDFVHSVQEMKGVQDADARRILFSRVLTSTGEWANLTIFAVEEYDGIRVNKIRPVQGAWPPPDRQILIERNALPLIGYQVGEQVLLEMPNEKQYILRIAGITHDMAQLPAQFDGTPYGYVSFKTLEWFGEPYGYNELHVIADQPKDRAYTQQVVNRVKNKAEKIGYTIPLTLAAEPGQIPTDDILQAILLLLGTLGVLSLFLSFFLIVNTVTALLAQQKRQIGVMKAIGARSRQLIGMYVVMVMIYGVLALLIALPCSVFGARALSQFMATMFNFDLVNLRPPMQTIGIQITIGLLIPVLSSLYPFLVNLRITAAEAMSDFQLGKGHFGEAWIDRTLSGGNLWFGRYLLLRPVMLSIRNIFRAKGRLVLTLITLILAGAIFIGVFSVNASLNLTMENMMKMWNFDILVSFVDPSRIKEIKQIVEVVPNVTEVDIWINLSARRLRPDGTESSAIYMFAPRAGSTLFPGPSVIQGRWLLPEDENALVVDALFLKDEPDLSVGDSIVLKIEGQEYTFRIVGVSMGILSPVIYGNYPYIARITGRTGESDAALIRTFRHGREAEKEIIAAVETSFERLGLRVSQVAGTSKEWEEADALFGVLVSLLMIMSILLAVVGGLGLMGTMSINVLERTREIGVLRAIGASNNGVGWVFIREGMAIGVLSWILGAICALPLAKILSDAVGSTILGTSLSFSYSFSGMWIWLILVSALSALASLLPARNASRLTVREVLAYE